MADSDAWAEVISDHARAEEGYRARRAWRQRAWEVNRVQQVRRATTLTAELAAQSEKKVFEVCSRLRRLHDEPAAERSIEPPAAKCSHLVIDSPPRCPFSLSGTVTTCSLLPVASKSLLGERGLNHPAGSFRAMRPRSTTRAQETAAVLEETLSLFVEATGEDEASMRQQLVSKRSEELRRSRKFWRTRVEEKQRLQAKKEEAWEFFRRLPSFKPKKKGRP